MSQSTERDEPPADIAIVYATFPNLDEAERIGGALVDMGLAACVNIVPGMVSLYVWEGKRVRESEVAMVVKTRRKLADAVVAAVRSRHPYSTPALLVLPVVGGSAEFLQWVRDQTAAANVQRG